MSVQHYENFPVASVLCPPRIRPAVVAIYHFARTADDLADEGAATAAQRLADLSLYRQDLMAALSGRAPSPRWRPLFELLAQRAVEFQLPTEPLSALLDAFEQDVHNPVYADRAHLLDYCRRSANPIGRLLLHLYGVTDARSLQQADQICSALQLINFWQDLSVDGPRGRIYVPEADMAALGVRRVDLLECRDGSAVRQLIAQLCEWAGSMMNEGAPLCMRLPGRAGWELRGVVQGGLRILQKIERMQHASLLRRPKLHAGDLPLLWWRAASMQGGAE